MKQEVLDQTFAIVEAAAAAGERCPQSPPMGTLRRDALAFLARAGWLRIEVFMHNFRVVTIMDGPHKGKQTMPPPLLKTGQRPRAYRMIYKDHVVMRGQQRKIAP